MTMFTDAVAVDASAGDRRVARRLEPCSARELYCGLVRQPARHPQLIAPALHFAEAALQAARASERPPCDELERWGARTLTSPDLGAHAPSWPARVVREFAPTGLCDGVWLEGCARSADFPSALKQTLLAQTSMRLLGAAMDGHAQRYANLLCSLGIVPEAITRWEFDESQPCADISYEHALLGLSLRLFPRRFGAETLGFNLWMATLGPAPLLVRLRAPLRAQGAWLSYVDACERAPLAEAARHAVQVAQQTQWTDDVAGRIVTGFVAAHHSYLRWERAMWAGNVPFTPADSVLDMVRRKARFSAEHHGAIRVRGHNVQELLEAGEDGHRLLVDALGASHWIRPGDPQGSRLLSHSLSIGGPMFDAFTASEKADLEAWVVALGRPERADLARVPMALAGRYTVPDDPAELQARAREQARAEPPLSTRRTEADADPITLCWASRAAERVATTLLALLANEPRLGSREIPPYDEQTVRAMAAPSRDHTGHPAAAGAQPGEGAFWLAGFVDVRHWAYDEYAFLTRSLLTLQGTSQQLPGPLDLFARAATRVNDEFIPELLGLHLGWLSHQRDDDPCRAWAVQAVLAFAKRTSEVTSEGALIAWQRLWRLWRCHTLLLDGTAEQRQILTHALSSALVPT